MYLDRKSGRVLLRDGKSVLSSFGYAKNIITEKPTKGIAVAKDYDSETYDMLNNTSLSVDVKEVYPEPKPHTHTDKDMDTLVEHLTTSDRYNGTEEEIERLEIEIDYFSRTNNIKFLLSCYELILKFIDDGVVWGVGRGSSCASYIAYLLYINDINPLDHDIPFSEMSKETE